MGEGEAPLETDFIEEPLLSSSARSPAPVCAMSTICP